MTEDTTPAEDRCGRCGNDVNPRRFNDVATRVATMLVFYASEIRQTGNDPELVMLDDDGVGPAAGGATLADGLWLLALELDADVAMGAV